MTIQKIVDQEPILPPDVKKHLFEGNNHYRQFFLQREVDEGTAKYFYYTKSNGEQTCMYNEEFVNGRWAYKEEIPYDAFYKIVGKIIPVDC